MEMTKKQRWEKFHQEHPETFNQLRVKWDSLFSEQARIADVAKQYRRQQREYEKSRKTITG